MQSEFEDPDGELEQEPSHGHHLTAAERLYNQAMDSKARVREAAQRAIQVAACTQGWLNMYMQFNLKQTCKTQEYEILCLAADMLCSIAELAGAKRHPGVNVSRLT